MTTLTSYNLKAMKNICIKCGVDLYATEGKFECQKHPKECKGIYLSEETLLIHAAEKKQQHLIDMMKADEELGLYEEPKQEITLEEAAEHIVLNNSDMRASYSMGEFGEEMFKRGAKWQQEQDKNKYSEEEVLELLNNLRLDSYNHGMGKIEFLEWFEQFKKK